LATADARRREPRLGALADQVALELRQRAEDMEDQLAAARRRVELLGQAPEADPAPLQPVQGRDQRRQGTPEPVEPPDGERVARPEVGQGRSQPRPLRLRTAHGVGEELLAARRPERVLLQGQGLLRRRDPRVAHQHRRPPALIPPPSPRSVAELSTRDKWRDIDCETGYENRLTR